jgi:hypothetical protein
LLIQEVFSKWSNPHKIADEKKVEIVNKIL